MPELAELLDEIRRYYLDRFAAALTELEQRPDGAQSWAQGRSRHRPGARNVGFALTASGQPLCGFL
jgi:hypothetical protein